MTLRDLPTQSKEATKSDDSVSSRLFEDVVRFATTAKDSFLYAGIQAPISGVAQLVDHTFGTDAEERTKLFNKPNEANFGSLDWHAEQVGTGLGMAADFLIGSKLLRAGASRLPIAGAETIGVSKLGLIGSSALTGALYQGVFTPVQGQGEDFATARLKNAFAGGVTFAALTGAGVGFRSAFGTAGAESSLATRFLKSDLSMGAVSGIAGGVVSAETGALMSGKWHPSVKDATQSAYAFMVAGAPLGVLHALSVPDSEKAAESPIPLVRPETTVANEHTIPAEPFAGVQSLSIDGRDSASENTKSQAIEPVTDAVRETERPTLTPANNPVGLLQQELGGYWQELTDRKGWKEIKENSQRFAVLKEIEGIKTDFAGRLLELWNGTPVQPGIANHTDAELATATMPVEKIAELRQAFTNGRHDIALAQMMGITEPDWRVTQAYGIDQNIMGPAKASFFDYQVFDKKMELPKDLDHKANRGGWQDPTWPVDYLPYQATSALPNLFHGTSALALDTIIQEKALLSANELRASGIQKLTGEGGAGYTPNDVSTLKYFNGGQSWATHSSDSTVAGYPLVVGISGDIVGRGRYGTQGGEVTFPTELKLDGKEVTHLFVPDREVPDVSRRLAARNVTNVQVVGFGAVEPPPYLRQGH